MMNERKAERIGLMILALALLATLVQALVGCTALQEGGPGRALADAVAPAPAGAPVDGLDAGLGLAEGALGAAGAVGLGGPVALVVAAVVGRGGALRGVARAVEARGDGGMKGAIAAEVARAGGGAGAALDGAIIAACGPAALRARRLAVIGASRARSKTLKAARSGGKIPTEV